MSTIKQFVCMKWGTLYGPDYVNRLYAMVRRNTRGEIRFVCLTERPEGIRPEVECFPCPSVNAKPPHDNDGWRKLTLWAPQVADLKGAFVYLDIDVVVTGPLDDFFTHPGEFCIMRNWTQMKRRVGNSSVFRIEVGAHTRVWEKFSADPEAAIRSVDNEQIYICLEHGNPTWWPDEWCISFKEHCVPAFPLNWIQTPRLPANTRVVAFHGLPNPPDAIKGEWPLGRRKPWKRLYKHLRPTSWVAEHWRE